MKSSTTTFRITPEAKKALTKIVNYWNKGGLKVQKAALINLAIIDAAKGIPADSTKEEQPQ